MGTRYWPAFDWAVSLPVIGALVLCYLACIGLLFRFMRNRAALHPTAAMRVYNVVQVVVCAYMAKGMEYTSRFA